MVLFSKKDTVEDYEAARQAAINQAFGNVGQQSSILGQGLFGAAPAGIYPNSSSAVDKVKAYDVPNEEPFVHGILIGICAGVCAVGGVYTESGTRTGRKSYVAKLITKSGRKVLIDVDQSDYGLASDTVEQLRAKIIMECTE